MDLPQFRRRCPRQQPSGNQLHSKFIKLVATRIIGWNECCNITLVTVFSVMTKLQHDEFNTTLDAKKNHSKTALTESQVQICCMRTYISQPTTHNGCQIRETYLLRLKEHMDRLWFRCRLRHMVHSRKHGFCFASNRTGILRTPTKVRNRRLNKFNATQYIKRLLVNNKTFVKNS